MLALKISSVQANYCSNLCVVASLGHSNANHFPDCDLFQLKALRAYKGL